MIAVGGDAVGGDRPRRCRAGDAGVAQIDPLRAVPADDAQIGQVAVAQTGHPAVAVPVQGQVDGDCSGSVPIFDAAHAGDPRAKRCTGIGLRIGEPVTGVDLVGGVGQCADRQRPVTSAIAQGEGKGVVTDFAH